MSSSAGLKWELDRALGRYSQETIKDKEVILSRSSKKEAGFWSRPRADGLEWVAPRTGGYLCSLLGGNWSLLSRTRQALELDDAVSSPR